ncbi:hypothetical protein [Longimicrobium sp.]|uniref:hypothetical protein n=1 Tax=Longimicrobium sp. TaxID=2029185 RepID=UPI002C6D2424|nr:hypothetical protein [Longimicrobium sp.]HSU17406.1 hypothetical protein [Longimicrobium sp.]
MRNPKLMALAAAVLACTALAACGENAEKKQAREQARRTACVASELALDAKVRLAQLDTQVVQMQGSPLEQVTTAGHVFAAAYRTYADAASRAADLADSAAFARSSTDSARYATMAQRAQPPAPQPGVEENAARRFEGDVREAMNNPDHPCNKKDSDDS